MPTRIPAPRLAAILLVLCTGGALSLSGCSAEAIAAIEHPNDAPCDEFIIATWEIELGFEGSDASDPQPVQTRLETATQRSAEVRRIAKRASGEIRDRMDETVAALPEDPALLLQNERTPAVSLFVDAVNRTIDACAASGFDPSVGRKKSQE